MKALLITLCGCSRMIDMSEREHTIRLPIKKPISLRNINMPLEPDFSSREFVFESIEESGSLRDVLIYRERAAE